MARHVVGFDFGTSAGRALVVRIVDGAEMGAAVHEYRHGVLDETLAATGERLPPDWALQDPEDYRDVLRHSVPEAVAAAGADPASVVGISVAFTACTVLPTLRDGADTEVGRFRQELRWNQAYHRPAQGPLGTDNQHPTERRQTVSRPYSPTTSRRETR